MRGDRGFHFAAARERAEGVDCGPKIRIERQGRVSDGMYMDVGKGGNGRKQKKTYGHLIRAGSKSSADFAPVDSVEFVPAVLADLDGSACCFRKAHPPDLAAALCSQRDCSHQGVAVVVVVVVVVAAPPSHCQRGFHLRQYLQTSYSSPCCPAPVESKSPQTNSMWCFAVAAPASC